MLLQAIAAIEAKMKIGDFVKRFSGLPDENLEQWLDRFEEAMDVLSDKETHAEKEKKMAKLMPLFLEGRAYGTWKLLTSDEKKDLAKVKAALRRVFGLSKLAAWQKLKAVRLLPGDSIDLLANDIDGLLRAAIGTDDPPNELVAHYVIDALPSVLADPVTMLHGEEMNLAAIISCVKSLTSGRSHVEEMGAAAKLRPRRPPERRVGDVRFNGQCWACQRWGHTRRDCPDLPRRDKQDDPPRLLQRRSLDSGNERAGTASSDRAIPALQA